MENELNENNKEDDMKKLLVLLLVLGMVSTANATMSIYIGQSSSNSTALTAMTLAAPGTFRVYMWCQTDRALIWNEEDPPEVIGGGVDQAEFCLSYDGVIVRADSVSGSTSAPFGASNSWGAIAAAVDATNMVAYGGYLGGLQDSFGPTYMGRVNLTALTGGVYTITQQNISESRRNYFGAGTIPSDTFLWTTNASSLKVTVVPEPMTMALLGFGGLFLRRRR